MQVKQEQQRKAGLFGHFILFYFCFHLSILILGPRDNYMALLEKDRSET